MTTALSGVSALAVPDQPTSKVMLVCSPSGDFMSRRWRPHFTCAAILAGASARDVDDAVGDAPRGLDRLVAPAPVGLIPLVIVAELVERPGHALARNARAVGADYDRLEIRRLAFAEAFVEILLDADRRALGAHRQRDDALDRAPAGFGDVDDDLGLQRLGGVGVGQVDREIGMALRVGLHLLAELVFDRGEFVVGEAADEAGIARDFRAWHRFQADRAGDVEAAGGRAVEEARIERDLDRLAVGDDLLGGFQREIEPLGHIVLEQESDVADRRRLRVGVGFDRPRPRRRARQQRHGERTSAEALVGDDDALVLDPVGSLHDESQRHAGLRDAARVAQQRGDIDGLARAIDAALGIEERIERIGRFAPRHAAIGQIERRLRHR